MKTIVEDTRAIAVDITTNITLRKVLGYMALGLSYVAALIAVFPIALAVGPFLLWWCAGVAGRKLIDDGQEADR